MHGTRVRSGSFIKGKSGAKGAGKTVVFDMILMEDINESCKISTLQFIRISNALSTTTVWLSRSNSLRSPLLPRSRDGKY